IGATNGDNTGPVAISACVDFHQFRTLIDVGPRDRFEKVGPSGNRHGRRDLQSHFPQIRDAKSPIEAASRSPVIDKAKEWPSGHRPLPPGERMTHSAASESGVSQPPVSVAFSISSSNALWQTWKRSGWTW